MLECGQSSRHQRGSEPGCRCTDPRVPPRGPPIIPSAVLALTLLAFLRQYHAGRRSSGARGDQVAYRQGERAPEAAPLAPMKRSSQPATTSASNLSRTSAASRAACLRSATLTGDRGVDSNGREAARDVDGAGDASKRRFRSPGCSQGSASGRGRMLRWTRRRSSDGLAGGRGRMLRRTQRRSSRSRSHFCGWRGLRCGRGCCDWQRRLNRRVFVHEFARNLLLLAPSGDRQQMRCA